MARKRMPVILALLAAVPIELWNIRVAATLFDPGPAVAGWRWKLIARQWVLLHLPGMLSLDCSPVSPAPPGSASPSCSSAATSKPPHGSSPWDLAFGGWVG